jgi:hypothetical protein
MRLEVRRSPGRARGLWSAAAAIFATAGLVAAAAEAGRGFQDRPAAGTPASPIEERAGHYIISAHIFLWGNWGEVGTMTVESALRKQGNRWEKSLRMAGASNEEMVRKRNRDYRGDFNQLKVYPPGPDGSVEELAVAEGRELESSSTGFLKLNKKYQAEKIAFFPDHAVATREDGTEKRVEGNYGCILSPLEYMMEHDLRVGQVFETPFLLNGIPRVFRCEVTDLDMLSKYASRAYRVDIWAVDRTTGTGRAPKDVWRRKGNVRVWFCKDGPYRNEMLRMRIKFRWYLWLYFDHQT